MRPFKKISLLALSTFCLGLPVVLNAAAAEPPRKEISDEVSSDLGKMKPLIDAKDYTGAVALLNSILAKAAPESYDTAMISQIKVQILLTEGKLEEAIQPLLTSHELGKKFGFYDDKVLLDQLYLLCQVHYQLAADAKAPERQSELYTKAYGYIRTWLDTTTKPTADAELFAASILYGQATMNPNKPDVDLLKKARAEASAGLHLSFKPNDQLYVLLLASLQQLADHKAAAELLELLVVRQPSNALYWQQLAGTYLNIATENTEDREIKRNQLRAILTMQRAQQNGLMNSPKENINMIGLYFNIEQYGKASELLSKALKEGKVENTRTNWELLGLAYSQANHEDKAVETLKTAADLFPTEGEIELTLGQMNYNAGRVENALTHLEKAVKKGNLKKPGSALLFLAFTAHELQRYDDAAKWADEASKLPDVKVDDAKRLRRAALEAIKEREELRSTKI